MNIMNTHHLTGTDVAELAQMLTTDKKWYQIYTRPNSEKKLYEKITLLGAEAYLPLRKIRKQWSDRVKTIEEPAFKSYMFAKLTSAEMRKIEKLSEFCFFVSYGGGNKSLSQRIFPNITDNTISMITKVLASFPETELHQNRLVEGERVLISSGNLFGYQGILLESPEGKKANIEKVAVEIEGLNQSLLVKIPVTFLQKVKQE